MGHSSHSTKNAVLSTLKMVIVGVLKLIFLIVSLCLGIIGMICTKIAETIKHVVEK